MNDTKLNNESETVTLTSPRKRVKAHIAELEQQVAALTAEATSERDRRVRLAAEYDNYRRRTKAEFQIMVETAGERVILKLLPVVDDLERLLNQPDGMDGIAFKQGTELIYKKLQASLASEGLMATQSIGQTFDAKLHEAVAEIPVQDAAAGSIVAEVEKGYRLGEKVIRFAKVVVAKEEGN